MNGGVTVTYQLYIIDKTLREKGGKENAVETTKLPKLFPAVPQVCFLPYSPLRTEKSTNVR